MYKIHKNCLVKKSLIRFYAPFSKGIKIPCFDKGIQICSRYTNMYASLLFIPRTMEKPTATEILSISCSFMVCRVEWCIDYT